MRAGAQERRTARFLDTASVIIQALVIALLIRTFLFQPFSIPSGSMEPTLLIGDYLFVSKFSYGYSRYSFPFSPPLFSGRIMGAAPRRGDVVVFRHAPDDFIKRVIGLPGEHIQVINGVVHINGAPVERHRIADFVGPDPCHGEVRDAPRVEVPQWQESLSNGVTYRTLQCASFPGFPDTTGIYTIPPDHFFAMGDNRENSEDSRFPAVGFVPFENLIGRAQIIFFSIANGDSPWELWRWPWSMRWHRLLQRVR